VDIVRGKGWVDGVENQRGWLFFEFVEDSATL
jgi:hypothetical protein